MENRNSKKQLTKNNHSKNLMSDMKFLPKNSDLKYK